MKIDEQQRLTPLRRKVLNNANRKARIALGQSLTFGKADPAYVERSYEALGKSSRADVLRQLGKRKKTGAYAGSTDQELKAELEHMRKLRTSEEHQKATKDFAAKESRERSLESKNRG